VARPALAGGPRDRRRTCPPGRRAGPSWALRAAETPAGRVTIGRRCVNGPAEIQVVAEETAADRLVRPRGFRTGAWTSHATRSGAGDRCRPPPARELAAAGAGRCRSTTPGSKRPVSTTARPSARSPPCGATTTGSTPSWPCRRARRPPPAGTASTVAPRLGPARRPCWPTAGNAGPVHPHRRRGAHRRGGDGPGDADQARPGRVPGHAHRTRTAARSSPSTRWSPGSPKGRAPPPATTRRALHRSTGSRPPRHRPVRAVPFPPRRRRPGPDPRAARPHPGPADRMARRGPPGPPGRVTERATGPTRTRPRGPSGPARSAQAEHPGRFGLVDLCGTPASEAAQPRAAALDRARVSVRDGVILVPRLTPSGPATDSTGAGTPPAPC